MKMDEHKKLPWPNKKINCVILCGGCGSRFLPLSLIKQKGMVEINNKPILGYIIDYWKKFTDNFVFVVKYKKQGIIDYVRSLPVNHQFVEPEELRGIANGISYVKDYVTDSFVVVLGDCICKGQFCFPPNMEQGVGIWKTSNADDIKLSYSVQILNGHVTQVVEKPQEVTNNLCGMGFYFFNRRVFDYIQQTKPSTLRNEIEITDVIQNIINAGERIAPVFFKGKYINITYTKDLKRAKEILKQVVTG